MDPINSAVMATANTSTAPPISCEIPPWPPGGELPKQLLRLGQDFDLTGLLRAHQEDPIRALHS